MNVRRMGYPGRREGVNPRLKMPTRSTFESREHLGLQVGESPTASTARVMSDFGCDNQAAIAYDPSSFSSISSTVQTWLVRPAAIAGEVL